MILTDPTRINLENSLERGLLLASRNLPSKKRQWHFEDRTYKVSFIWNQGLGRCSLPWCQLATCEPDLCRRPGADVQRPSMYRYEYMNAPSFRFSIYWVSSLTAAMQVGIHILWSARCFLDNYDRASRLSSCLYPIPHALAENAARLWGGSALTEVTPNDILKGCLHYHCRSTLL